MSLDMSLPQNVPALQQENLALRKQLRRAEEDHRDALEKAERQGREALVRLEESYQKVLSRAHEDLHDAQDMVSKTLETNQSVVQQLAITSEQRRTTALESQELRKQLEGLKKQHQAVLQESLKFPPVLKELQDQRRLAQEELLSHQEQSRKLYHKYHVCRIDQRTTAEALRQLSGSAKMLADKVGNQVDLSAQMFDLGHSDRDTADNPEDDKELREMRRRLQELRNFKEPPSRIGELSLSTYKQRYPSERQGRPDIGSDNGHG